MARLTAPPGDAELIRAAARNHASWFRAAATVAGGGVMRSAGLTWVAPPAGGEAVLPFPRRASRPALDAMLRWCRRHDVAGIGCWTTGLESTTELAARLVARGFEWGWMAHWMAIDLAALPLGETDPRVSLATEVPEYDGNGKRMLELTSGRFWHAVAREDGGYAGRAWAHVTGGRLGCAGIYDVDVAALERLAPRKALLRARLPGNRLTLPQVALAAGQHATAEWLVARGRCSRSARSIPLPRCCS